MADVVVRASSLHHGTRMMLSGRLEARTTKMEAYTTKMEARTTKLFYRTSSRVAQRLGSSR